MNCKNTNVGRSVHIIRPILLAVIVLTILSLVAGVSAQERDTNEPDITTLLQGTTPEFRQLSESIIEAPPLAVSVNLSQLREKAHGAIAFATPDWHLKNIRSLKVVPFSPSISDQMQKFLEAKYASIFGAGVKGWAEALCRDWQSAENPVALLLLWEIGNDEESKTMSSVAVLEASDNVLYDSLLADIRLDTTLVSADSTKTTSTAEPEGPVLSATLAAINPIDTDTIYESWRVYGVFGSVVLNYRVTLSSEISPYIAPITNDGKLTGSVTVTCWRSDPTGIPPSGEPIVYFGDGGTVDNQNDPFESTVAIQGLVDHFHTGTYKIASSDGLGKSWTPSFNVSFIVGISILPPSDPTSPISLIAPNSTGRQINITDKVYSDWLAARYRGVFWNGGSVGFDDFIIRVENGGSETGNYNIVVPVHCAYSFWAIVPVFQDVGYGGILHASGQYLRGHKVPDPQCIMVSNDYSLRVGDSATLTVTVTNPSQSVSMDSGQVSLDTGSFGITLRVVGSATKTLGTIQPASSENYYFTVEGQSSGTVRPQASVSGRWGWPAGDAGKTFSVTCSLDKNIEVVRSLVSIAISGPTQVNESSGAQYTCTAYYNDDSTSDVTDAAIWSENSPYATINNTGYLTAGSVTSDQPCRITATYSGKTDTHDITIKNVPPMLSYIVISGPTQVNESSGAQYTCTAHYSDGSTSNVTSSASWTENSSYASISGSGYLSTSPVTSDQPCRITASYSGKSDYHDVTIKNIPPVLDYITISGPTQVNESSGAQYTCTAYYTDGTNSNVSSSASWTENSSYASISGSGYLSTSSVSSYQPCCITATYGGKSDTHDITIKNVQQQVATPDISPASGTYSSPITITMSCGTAGATIRYTANGSEPTESSPVYAGPVQVSGSPGTSKTVKAKAFKSGYTPSDTATRNYTFGQTYAIRTAPGYVAGSPARITIEVVPDASTQVYAVEETPPAGWPVSSINEGGIWDDINKKVKWGPFFDNNFRTLAYNVTAPIGTTGCHPVSGIASFDGVDQPIGGDNEICEGLNHPADHPNADWQMVISEVTGYGAAWKTGQQWPVDPNPIPISYVTRAGYLWKGGECYSYNSQVLPPMCWVLCQAGSGLLQQVVGTSGAVIAESGTTSTVTRSFDPTEYTPEQSVLASIVVDPGASVQVYAVEDTPPAGWTVSSINENGAWDDVNKKVKWGPFFDNNPRIFTYVALPPTGESGLKTFSGIFSADGVNTAVTGQIEGPVESIAVSWVEICVGWDYNEPNAPNDLTYDFYLGLETDDTVNLVEFETPAANTFQISKQDHTQAGEVETWHYVDGGTHYWEYEADFSDQANLLDYGDGTYTITVYYEGGDQDQTTVWFGIPGTTNPIPQPIQQPVLTFPEHNGATTSPVAFKWQDCTDANATSLWLCLEKDGSEEEIELEFPVDVNSSDPCTLSLGVWKALLSFDHWYDYNSVDGIPVEVGKYSESNYTFALVAMVTVPDVFGLSQANAESAITSAGLTVGNITHAYSDTVAAGDVISQNPAEGTSVVINSAVDLVISDGPKPHSIIMLNKCRVKAGKYAGQDMVLVLGQIDATEEDLHNASDIQVTVNSDDMPEPCVANFPINDKALKKGKYNYARTENASKTLFKLNTKNGKFTFKAKKIDLTGLSCPVSIEISIGNYVVEGRIDEDIVNGPKKSIPIRFMMGVKDILRVDKVKVKSGKKSSTDSLLVKGAFALKDEPGDISAMTLNLDGQTFTIPGDKFIYKKNSAMCKKADTGSGLVSAKFNIVKCSFIITIKKADIEAKPGKVDFGILIDMDTGSFNETVEVDLD